MTSPRPAKGPYCFSSSSQLILTAARLYFAESSFNLELKSPIFSKLSPRYRRSLMFFVMIEVTSLSSSLSRDKLSLARESWYVFFVFSTKRSNSE